MKVIERCIDSVREERLLLYFIIMSSRPFELQSENDRADLIETHEHLKRCEHCRNYYKGLKADASSDTSCSGTEFATPAAFALVRRNETYLDSL